MLFKGITIISKNIVNIKLFTSILSFLYNAYILYTLDKFCETEFKYSGIFCNTKCSRTFLPVEAQSVRPIATSLGINIQNVGWDSASSVLFISDAGRKTITRHNIFNVTDQVLQLGKIMFMFSLK